MQLISSLNHTVSVIAVNHKDKALCVLEVVSPQRTNLNPTTRQTGRFFDSQRWKDPNAKQAKT